MNKAGNRYLWRVGRRLYCDARGEQRTGSISDNGERFLQSVMVARAPNDVAMTVFDIGANQGEWTTSLLHLAPDSLRNQTRLSVHAFEPVPGTAAIFRDQMAKTKDSAIVQLHEVAMSSTPGRAQIGVYADGAGTNTLHFAGVSVEPQQQIEVTLRALDEFCSAEGIGHIHLAKCDTEGHDLNVLKGAAEMLAAGCIDVIQFEYNHRWIYGRAYLKDVFDLIDELPYTLVRVDPERLTVFDVWHPELDRFFQSNYALVHERMHHWLPLHRGHFDGFNTYA